MTNIEQYLATAKQIMALAIAGKSDEEIADETGIFFTYIVVIFPLRFANSISSSRCFIAMSCANSGL